MKYACILAKDSVKMQAYFIVRVNLSSSNSLFSVDFIKQILLKKCSIFFGKFMI